MKAALLSLLFFHSLSLATPTGISEEERTRYPNLYHYYVPEEGDEEYLTEEFKTYLEGRVISYINNLTNHDRQEYDYLDDEFGIQQDRNAFIEEWGRGFVRERVQNEQRRLSFLRKIEELRNLPGEHYGISLTLSSRCHRVGEPASAESFDFYLDSTQAVRVHRQIQEIKESYQSLPRPVQASLKNIVLTQDTYHFISPRLRQNSPEFFIELTPEPANADALYERRLQTLYVAFNGSPTAFGERPVIIPQNALVNIASQIYQEENEERVAYFESQIPRLPLEDRSLSSLNFHNLVYIYAREVYPIRETPELIARYHHRNIFARFLNRLDDIDMENPPQTAQELERYLREDE